MKTFEDKISVEVAWIDKEGCFGIEKFDKLSKAFSFKRTLMATTKATHITVDTIVTKRTRLSEELF
jgi:hypothetical protein